MAKIFIEESTLSAIGDSIRAKTGKTDMIQPLNMPTEIASIQAGGSSAPVSSNEITFYDYDGTVVASYSLAEAQALTALPDGPTHAGLTFQGWNWSLADINALTRPMNVGAMYITDDGKTRLYIHIADKARSTVPLYISQTVANGVTIDWGDGSATETLAGTGNVNTSHAYGAAGDFTISLAVADGCTLELGHGSSSYCVMGNTGNNGKVYCNMLMEANIGKSVSGFMPYIFANCQSLSKISIPDSCNVRASYCFCDCYSLKSITVPKTKTTILNQSEFSGCRSLSTVCIPYGLTEIGESCFSSCYCLPKILIPETVKTIGTYAFSQCSSLKCIDIPDTLSTIPESFLYECRCIASVTIPNGVTSIGSYTFYNCYGVAEYHLKPTTPPILSNTNAFEGIPSDCTIYVPKGCLDAYQNATNWSMYASKMQEEP